MTQPSNLYQASKEQNNILRNNKAILNIAYIEPNVAAHTIFLCLLDKYVIGKTAMVICSDKAIRETLEEYIETSALKLQVLSFDPNADVSWEILSSAYKRASGQKKASTISDQKIFESASYNLLFASERKDFASLKSSVDALATLPKPAHYNSLLQDMSGLYPYDFDLNATKMKLQKVASIFKLGYRFDNNTQDIYSESNINSIQALKHRLEVLIDNMSGLYVELMQKYSSFESITSREIQSDIAFLKLKLPLLKVEKKLPASKGLLSIFKNKKSLEPSSELLSLEDLLIKCRQANIKLRDFNSLESFESVLMEIENQVRLWDETKYDKSAEQISRINAINFPVHAKELQQFENQLLEITAEINGLNIFGKKYELNTINFTKQLEIGKALELDLTKYEHKYQQYQQQKEWFETVKSCSTSEHRLLNALYVFETNKWVDTFSYWYHSMTIRGFHLDDMEIQDSDIRQWLTSNTDYNIKSKYHQSFDEIQHGLIEMVKKNGTLKDKLNGTNTNESFLPWKTLIKNEMPLVKALFPLLIAHNDGLYDTIEHGFDTLIYVNSGTINIEILQFFPSILTFYHADLVPSSAVMDHVVLNAYTDLPLKQEWTYASAYKISHLLTENLDPKVYQLRKGMIVSFASPQLEKILSSTLHRFGLKTLDDRKNVQSNILTLLMQNQKPNVVVTIDSILDTPSRVDSVLLLDYLEGYGFTHINIKSKDMLVNPSQCVSDFESNLMSVFSEK